MLKHEGIPVKLMAGIPFCREIIHQEIKVKKTIILTLLLITALAANGCGNKKNVTDMKDKETTVSAVQQETTQLRTQETTTGLTMDSETQQEETTEEELLALVEKLNADDTVNGILVLHRLYMRQHRRQQSQIITALQRVMQHHHSILSL